MLLKIVQAGAPVLRQRAVELTDSEITSPATRELIGEMREAMHEKKGAGLAGPQIGKRLRIIVVEDLFDIPEEQRREQQREPVEFYTLINPELTVEDTTPIKHFEGCLSVTDGKSPYQMLVPRASIVRVRGKNQGGEPVDFVARGWHARLLQHEVDHLNGTLCIDRMHPRSFMTKQNYTDFWKPKAVVEIERELRIDWGRREDALEEDDMEEKLQLVRSFVEFLKQQVGQENRLTIDGALAVFEQQLGR